MLVLDWIDSYVFVINVLGGWFYNFCFDLVL